MIYNQNKPNFKIQGEINAMPRKQMKHEYDEEENEKLCVDEEAVRHGVEVDGETYTVYDGFFEPSGNGYVIKRYNEGETIQDIKPQDIKRSASIFLGSQ